jgi:hypothetical protein
MSRLRVDFFGPDWHPGFFYFGLRFVSNTSVYAGKVMAERVGFENTSKCTINHMQSTGGAQNAYKDGETVVAVIALLLILAFALARLLISVLADSTGWKSLDESHRPPNLLNSYI